MIDLNLARSYKPVCTCFVFACFLLAVVMIMENMQSKPFHVYLGVALLLFMDSTNREEIIFDVNNMVSFICFSFYFNQQRNTELEEDPRKFIFAFVINSLWTLFGVFVMLRLDQKISIFQYIPINNLFVSMVLLSSHAFVYQERESDFIRFMRMFDFLVLSVIWMYLFYANNLSTRNVFDCIQCMMQFGSVLFTFPVIALCASILFIIIMVYDYHNSCNLLTIEDISFNDHGSDIENDLDMTDMTDRLDTHNNANYANPKNEVSLTVDGHMNDDTNGFTDVKNSSTMSHRQSNTPNNIFSDEAETKRLFLEAVKANSNKFKSLHG